MLRRVGLVLEVPAARAVRQTRAARQVRQVHASLKRPETTTRESDVVDGLLDAIAHAQDECALGDAGRCAAAWDAVQDITTGLHKVRERDYPPKSQNGSQGSLCDVAPWAAECLEYDV